MDLTRRDFLAALLALAAARSTPDAPDTIHLIPAGAWGAAPPRSGLVPHRIDHAVVHHTGVALDDNRQAPGRLLRWDAFHREERGWPTIAYHVVIDRNGHCYEGRDVAARGDTATAYDPTGAFLVACEGDFDHQEPSAAQLDRLVEILAWGRDAFGFPTTEITGHRDHAATACPGDALYDRLADGTLQRRVAAATRPRLVRLAPLDGRRLVRAIAEGRV